MTGRGLAIVTGVPGGGVARAAAIRADRGVAVETLQAGPSRQTAVDRLVKAAGGRPDARRGR